MSTVNEKKIYKTSLLKVVDYLNTKENEEEEPYSKKKIRQEASLKKKQEKLERKKKKKIESTNNDTTKNIKEDKKSNDETIPTNEPYTKKLTRKERRLLKIQNKGKGLSSKEYMKTIKKTETGKKLEIIENKAHIPSKVKDQYPIKKNKQVKHRNGKKRK